MVDLPGLALTGASSERLNNKIGERNMNARNVTIEQMERALKAVNRKYKGNVAFETFTPRKNGVDFTLRTYDSKGPGARRSFSGRRMPKACWHAHGDFFEAVLKIAPEAVIISRGGPGARIDRNGGNWQDCNIGSQVQPLMFSEACDCNH